MNSETVETVYGPMPANLTCSNLQDLCVEAGIQTGPFGSQLHQEDYVQSGTPIITVEHLGENRIVHSNLPQVSDDDKARLSKYVLRTGDIVFSRVGSVDRRALVQPTEEGWLFSGRCLRVRPDARLLDAQWLSYFFGLPAFKNYIRGIAVGATMPSINTKILSDIPIYFPDLATQREAALTLAQLDDRITLLRETNATLEAIAKALFKSWFVDFDPVCAKMEGRVPEGMDEATAALFPDALEETELGVVPRAWRETTLANLISQSGGSIQTGPFGSQLHASDYVENGVPVVMPKDISHRRVQTDSIARVPPTDADRLARHKLAPGDVLFSRRGDVERHALISETERGWLCGTGCLLVRSGKKWPSPNFLSLLLDAPQSRTWLVQHAVGATMPNLNTGILGSVPVVIPSTDLLLAFENIVSALEARRAQNSDTAQTLSTLRDTLLPRLISGQLRVEEATTTVEKAFA